MKLLLPLVLVLGIGAAPPLERIEMTAQSWGRPVSQWSIDAAGHGTHTKPDPGVFNAKRMVTRRIAVGRAGYAKIRSLLAKAKPWAGRELPCTRRITDQVYGNVRWVREKTAELRFDNGCGDAEARAVLEALRRADHQVAAWSAKAPIAEIKQVESQ